MYIYRGHKRELRLNSIQVNEEHICTWHLYLSCNTCRMMRIYRFYRLFLFSIVSFIVKAW